MRKDVKFGLTIGGLLVLVMIIWVTVNNRNDKKKTGDLALGPNPDDNTPVVDPAPQTPAVTPPQAPSGGQGGDVQTPDPARGGSDGSAHPAPAHPGPAQADWNRLLATGNGATLGSPIAVTMSDARSTPRGDPLGEPAGPSTRPASAGRTHVVGSGDTFSTISAEYYGSSKYWKRIADANPNVNSNRLRIGQVLNIPAVGDSVRADTAAAAPAPSGGAVADLDPARSYRVQPEDTLIKIARKLYGRGADWARIYDANKDAIGPNAARLKVGMILRLPEAPTAAAASAAAPTGAASY